MKEYCGDNEYGMGKDASTEGDVYSFGVVVLEMVSGRRPTEVLSHEGSSLCEWLKRQYTNHLHNFLQQALQRFSPCAVPNHISKDSILQLIHLALLCTHHNPSTRPTMHHVAQQIQTLKDYLINTPF
ncbi:putative leucine-rich repeat receptor-like serine/threonine-protein kinase, partial [Mucuna pruriens]